mmetsp:Transcript_27499/g.24331  ORF Transcript_27499/g.24331 Transcript_27499/m.24331 type:complete len:553 (-) Transcript_27499:190-1848(-)
MELKQMSLLMLILILFITIAHPPEPESMDCCDSYVGHQCFCERDDLNDEYYYLYYGECECNEISSLSVVLLTEDYAKSITFFDTNNEENVHCSFEHIHEGDEISCKAKGDRIFTESTSFKIERDDGSICKGSIDTGCDDVIINKRDEDACPELAVTGYVDEKGGVCDDGLEPCYCRGGFQQRYYIHDAKDSDSVSENDASDESETGSDGIDGIDGIDGSSNESNDSGNDENSKSDGNEDKDSSKLNGNDVDSKLESGDGMIISPLFAEYLHDKDKKHGIIHYSDSSGDSSNSDSKSKSKSKSESKSESQSKSKSESKSSKSKSKSSSSNSDSGSDSKGKSKSNSKSSSSDSDKTNYKYGNGKFNPKRMVEPAISAPLQVSQNIGDVDDASPDDEDDKRTNVVGLIDDDDLLPFIDSDESNDGVYIDPEDESDERDEAIAAPINMEPPININIIEPDSKSSIYVSMSYYIILMIVFINTIALSYYFCIIPLNKHCKDNNYHYTEYFKKAKPKSLEYNGYSDSMKSKHIIISSVDADNDTDVSSLSEATEDEEE